MLKYVGHVHLQRSKVLPVYASAALLRCSPRSHHFPCCGHARYSTGLWHEVGGAGAFAQLVLKELKCLGCHQVWAASVVLFE